MMKQNSPSPATSEATIAVELPRPPFLATVVPGTSPFTYEQLKKAANRYAPVVRFHPQEKYLLCTVDWYLERGTLCGPNGYKKVSPTVADLPTGNIDDGKFWLEMTEEAKKGDLSIARVYVHAYWQPGNDYTDLQYWFCYGFNGPGTLYVANLFDHTDVDLAPLGEHWIDWEQMTIRIKNTTQEVLGVYLSQHGEGQWITDLTKFQRVDDQFIVYASLNDHAVYAQTGENPTNSYDAGVLRFRLRNDTADGGAAFDSAGKLDIVSADLIPGLTEPRWLHYPYRYGAGADSHLTARAVADILNGAPGPYDTNGVYGPQTQSYWTGQGIPKFNINAGYTGWNTNPNTPPSVVFFKGLWHIFFVDHNGRGIMHVTSKDGLRWDRANCFYTGVNTGAGPCAVVFKNILYVFFRDGSGNGILYIESADGETFKAPLDWYIGLDCDGQPTAAVLGDKLCLTCVDSAGNGVMWAVWTGPGGKWASGYTGWNTNNVDPCAPPCIAAFGGVFHLFFMDHNGRGILHLTSADGTKWSQSDVFYTGSDTSAGPASITFDKLLYVFFRDGSGNGILYIQSSDGKGFKPAPCWYIGLNCDFEPRIASTPNETRMCLVCVDQGGSGIMRAVFTPW